MIVKDANDNAENEEGEKLPFSFKKNEVPPGQVKAHWEKIAVGIAKNERSSKAQKNIKNNTSK